MVKKAPKMSVFTAMGTYNSSSDDDEKQSAYQKKTTNTTDKKKKKKKRKKTRKIKREYSLLFTYINLIVFF